MPIKEISKKFNRKDTIKSLQLGMKHYFFLINLPCYYYDIHRKMGTEGNEIEKIAKELEKMDIISREVKNNDRWDNKPHTFMILKPLGQDILNMVQGVMRRYFNVEEIKKVYRM